MMSQVFLWVLCTLAHGAAACPSNSACCSETWDTIEEKDVKYGEADFKGQPTQLLMDLYRPCASHLLPVVIYVHGSGFSPMVSKDNEATVRVCRQWAQRGFLVASIDYRKYGMRDMPKAFAHPVQDTLMAIRYLVANCGTLGCDPHNIALHGCSSGGIVVSHTVIQDFVQDTPGGAYGSYPANITVGISMAGGLIALFPPNKTAEKIPPYLSIHYREDPQVKYSNSVTTEAVLQELGATSHELMTLEGNGHCPPDLLAVAGQGNSNLMNDLAAYLMQHMTLPHCSVEVATKPECTTTSSSSSSSSSSSTSNRDQVSTSRSTMSRHFLMLAVSVLFVS